MDPRAQDVLLCDLCNTNPLQSYCEHCHINLCTNCVSKHVSGPSKKHNIVPYHLHSKFTQTHSKCSNHAEKDCKLYCEKCEIPVCPTCLSSGKHDGHTLFDVMKKLDSKNRCLRDDLEELETKIYPRYEETASDVRSEKAELEKNYGKLAIAAEQQGEVWHRQITAIVNQLKSDIAETKIKDMAVLEKHISEIMHRIVEIKQVILEIKNILDTNDISLTSTYKSRNNEFNQLSPKIKVTLPSLSTPTINTEKLTEMFGSLSSLSITKIRPLLDEPRLDATIDTDYTELYSVCCLGEQIWTCGRDKIMKLFNLGGKLLTSIKTRSGDIPWGITVTRDGYLVYTDPDKRTVNLVKNKKIQNVITLHGWKPRYVCSTSDDDLLLTMFSDSRKQSKVVRYSDFTETQTIQFDDQGRLLYSSGFLPKYISENRNLDICVADYEAEAVVVVNRSGNLRFRYTGHPSYTKKLFHPYGITTDSQSHILTADCYSHRIHILDQDGQFLQYIQNCNLRRPWGLCVDIRDNLLVAEWDTAKVKKIQYL